MKYLITAILLATNLSANEPTNNTASVTKQELDEAAFHLFERNAPKGKPRDQYTLGLMYFEGKGTEKNFDKSFYWNELAAKQGLADAQTQLGWMYYNGIGVEKNFEKAFHWYELAAKQNDAHALHEIGILYYYGEGVKANLKKAYESWKKASKDKTNIGESAKNKLSIICDENPGLCK